jgi:hypothetical protein
MMSCGKLLRSLGIAIAMLLLCGCSALRVTYNNAPGLTEWWLDHYLNFTTAQEDILQPQLETMHDWHRHHELPVYVDLLAQMQALAVVDITPARSCEVLSAMLERINVLNAQFEPVVASLAPTLSEEQLVHLQQRFDESNEEWREEWMDGSDEERKEYRVKQAIKRAEMFYGDLDKRQVDILRAHIAVSSFVPEVSYAERLRRQQDAVQTLTMLHGNSWSDAQMHAEIHQFFLRLADSPDLDYRQYLATVIHESCVTTTALHNSTNAEQRAHAAEELQGYQEDLRALHAPPGTQQQQ